MLRNGDYDTIQRLILMITKYNHDSQKIHHANLSFNSTCESTMVLENMIIDSGIPCVNQFFSELTWPGYVGKDIFDVFVDLLDKAGGDLEKAQNGVVILSGVEEIISLKKLDLASCDSHVFNIYDKYGNSNNYIRGFCRKIFNDAASKIKYNDRDYYFDSSRLTVIFAGDFDKIFTKDELENVIFRSNTIYYDIKDMTVPKKAVNDGESKVKKI